MPLIFFNSQDIKRQSIQIIRATLVLIVPSFQDEMFILNRFKNLLLSDKNVLCLHVREQSNKRRVKEIVKEFSLLCRGLQGAAY